LTAIGATQQTFVRDDHNRLFECLIIQHLDVDILAEIPFMEVNDIAVSPAKCSVILGDGTTYMYGSSNKASDSHTIRRAFVLHAPATSTTV